MKAKREHRVPLSEPALAILRRLDTVRVSEFIFPGQKRGRPLSATVLDKLLRRMKVTGATPHGFRSSFRDWAGNETNTPREIAEAALAHSVCSAVEAAYRSSDALEKRRGLMEAWARHCEPRVTGAAKIVELNARTG